RPGERPTDLPSHGPLERREPSTAHGVPEQAEVAVRRVAPRAEPERPAERLASDVDQRTHERRRDRVDAGHRVKTRARDRRDQDRLGLVIERMAERDSGGADLPGGGDQRRHANRAGPLLHRPPPRRRRVGLAQVERHAQSLAERADVAGIQTRVRPQPVVEVKDLYPDPEQPAERNERVEETDGVGAAGARDEDRLAGQQHLVPTHGAGHPLEHPGDRRGAAHQRPATLATQRSGFAIASIVGRFASSFHTRLKPSIPARSTAERTNSSPASYWRTFESK